MKEQWRQQMRQKMADYRQPAPEVSWDEIEGAVAKNKQKAKVVAMWPRRIAAVAVVLVTVGAGYYLLNREQTDIIEETAETLLKEGTIRQEPVVPQQQELSDFPLLAQAKRHVQEAIQKKKVETLSMFPIVEDTIGQKVSIVEEMPETQEPSPQETKAQQQPQTSSLPQPQPVFYPSDLKRSASSSKRLMAKVYLSNAMSGNSGYSFNGIVPEDYYKSYNAANCEEGSIGNYINPTTLPSDGTTAEIDGKLGSNLNPSSTVPVTEEAHHHQPIHFGLVLRYALNDRWSIEGGLSYALLTSDFRLSSGSYSADIEQRLSYIGVPLNVNYQLWGGRRFGVYASLGGMAEKMVKGKRHAVTQPAKIEEDASVSIRPLQFSVNGGLGAEFLFTDWLSLYAEPGVGYWFDNGSEVPTFYQDKPFSFNLNLGLRFTIK